MLKLRTANEQDCKALAALLAHLHTSDVALTDAEFRCAFVALERTPGMSVLVAEMNERIVSSCYLNVIPNLTRGAQPYAVIENVVTLPAYRGRGIGRRVVQEGIERARRAGCYKVMLLTGRKDDKVRRFYRSCGFAAGEKEAFVYRCDADE